MTYVTLSYDGLYGIKFTVPNGGIDRIEASMRHFARQTETLEQRIKLFRQARDSVVSEHQGLRLEVFQIPSGEDGAKELLALIEHPNSEIVEAAARQYISLAGEPSMIVHGSNYELARRILNYFGKDLRIPTDLRWLLSGNTGAKVVNMRTASS